MVGHKDALLGSKAPEGKTRSLFGVAALEPDGKLGVVRDVDQDIEEFGALLQRAQMGGEVSDIESPEPSPLELGPALSSNLVEIGVVPQIGNGAREPSVAVEQTG